MENNEYRLFGTDRVIRNEMVMRRSIDDGESSYCSVIGYYPSYKCGFYIHNKDRKEKSRKVAELYEILMKDGYKVISTNYSNRTNDDEYDDEPECISDDIILFSFTVYNDNSLISFGSEWSGITVMSHESVDVIKEIKEKYLKKYLVESDSVKCNMIAHDHNFYLEEFEIKVEGDLDLDLYNDGFEKINDEIIRSIREDDNGLYILHGEAGTGKTTYIRHLIKQLKKEKKFVYVPSNLVDEITRPKFVSFIMDTKNVVFIIEDCENLVVTKNNTRSSAVADMLNMTDGILSDALKIKFICTFNTNERNIDEALLRPGRCRMKYDFGKLKKERAVKAAEKLGLKIPDKDISLAELFAGENKYVEQRKKIGF